MAPAARSGQRAGSESVRGGQVGQGSGQGLPPRRVLLDPVAIASGWVRDPPQATLLVKQSLVYQQRGRVRRGGAQWDHQSCRSHRHPGAEAGSDERAQGRMPDKGRVPAAIVLAVHEERIIDGRGMVCQVVVGVEEAGGALDAKRVVEPDAI